MPFQRALKPSLNNNNNRTHETAAAQSCHVPAAARGVGRRAQGRHRGSVHMFIPSRAPRHPDSCTPPWRAVSQSVLSSSAPWAAHHNISNPDELVNTHHSSAPQRSPYSMGKDQIFTRNISLPPSPPISLQALHYAPVQTSQSLSNGLFRQEADEANPEGAPLAHHVV